jgi:diguanylate cyclase (GGDEF)-like protein/PAS domain S-box-containing protein
MLPTSHGMSHGFSTSLQPKLEMTAYKQNSRLSNPSIQVVILFLILIVSIWSAIHRELQSAQAQIARVARSDGANLSRAFAEQVRASVRGIDLTLLTLREDWRKHRDQFPDAVARQQNYFIQEMSFQVGVIDADGILVYSNLDFTPVSLADREHFRVHRDGNTDKLFISKPVLGRVSKRWSIQFTRPIFSNDKHFLGVLVISVDPQYFSRFYDKLNLDKDDVITLVKSSGEILARAPNPEQGLGKVLHNRPFLAIDAPENGNFQLKAQIDDIERIFSWRILKEFGLVVLVGESVKNQYASYYLQRNTLLLGGAIGSTLLLFFAGTVLLGIRQRAATIAALKASEEHWKFALEGSGDAAWQWNLQSGELQFSERLHEMLGVAEDAIGSTFDDWKKHIHEDDLPHVMTDIQAYLRGDTSSFVTEHRIRCTDSSVKWFLARGMAIKHDKDGKPIRMIGTLTDMSDRRMSEEKLRVAAVAFESQEGMMITDAHGVILRVNRAFQELTGYSAADVLGKTPAILKSGRQDPGFYKQMWDAIGSAGHWEGEIWNRKKSGEIYPEWLIITAVKDRCDRVTHYVAAFSDITTRKDAEAQIRNLAFYDPLTSLPNRRLLSDRVTQVLAASARSGRYGALMLLDLDHFKTLNDTLGHDVGDQLLRQVAQRLCATVRAEDTVARLGGDEFVVMVQDLSNDGVAAAAQTEAIAEKILASLNCPYPLKGVDAAGYRNTPSIGITQFRGHEETFDVLLKQADIALYKAKDEGRNMIRFYSVEMQAALNEKAIIETGLRNAIENNGFRLHYQPQVDHAHRIVGAEALLRWQPPGKPMVLPARFIAIAEETGLILQIGQWVLESACVQLAAWSRAEQTRELEISINVSARQFHQPGFVSTVRATLAAAGADPALLRLELTETMVQNDVEDTINKMRELRELGVSFALDDFGTGYSSLSYLKRLPIDQVKIDQSFVRDIATDPSDAAIVQTIIRMSHTLGLQVIAEGVETQEQLAFLEQNRCGLFQGYLFGHPMPPDQFNAMLTSSEPAAI